MTRRLKLRNIRFRMGGHGWTVAPGFIGCCVRPGPAYPASYGLVLQRVLARGLAARSEPPSRTIWCLIFHMAEMQTLVLNWIPLVLMVGASFVFIRAFLRFVGRFDR